MNGNNSQLQPDNAAGHRIVLTAQTDLEISGVTDVSGFDETFVSLETTAGALDIEGVGLAVQSLSLENGRIRVTGQVTGLWYSERQKKKERRHSRGLFGLGG